MSSFRYSMPVVPSREVLADMVVFYATPGVRARLMGEWPEDQGLLEVLVEELTVLIGGWRPSCEWEQLAVVRSGRTLEWLAWRVAVGADEDLGPMYRSDAVSPFAIDLATLPRYAQPPTMYVDPDDID